MSQRSVCFAALALLLVAASACEYSARVSLPKRGVGSEPPPIDPIGGGQSGGEGQTACTKSDQPLAAAVSDGLHVAALVGRFEAALESSPPLQWFPKIRGRTPIALTRLALTLESTADTADVGCSCFTLPAQLRLRSEDGLLDARFEGTLNGMTSGAPAISVVATLVDGELREGPETAGVDVRGPIALELTWVAGTPETLSGNLNDLTASAEPIAYIGQPAGVNWSDAGQLAGLHTFKSSDLQRRVCAAQTPTTRAEFASEEELRDKMTRIWVVCSGTGAVSADFAGFRVDALGRWHELRVEAGELWAVQGFEHEGQFARNVFGDDFNLALLDWLPARYEFATAELSADEQTLRIKAQQTDSYLDATFQAMNGGILYPQTGRSEGERAGLAGCDEQEVDVISRPGSKAELRELLVGRWLFCRGRFGTQHAGIEISADNTYRYLQADGSPVRGSDGTYLIIDTSEANGPNAFQINLRSGGVDGDVTLGMPIFAKTPLKMLARDDFASVLSAF
ncbi:MAG TPA: hypothetical protein VJV78_17605 [Polyangiales bacterium]|nr:hypothetical protein [Polyangiales bacterium]